MIEALLFFVPMVACVGIAYLPIHLVKRDRRRRNLRPPTTDKILRPPGESLRIKINDLRDELDSTLMLIMSVGFALGFILLLHYVWPMTVWTMALGLVASLVPATVLLIRLIFKLREQHIRLTNHRLGFDGERYVGHFLDQLMLQGCRVYHDFQTDKLGNIDHVVVAPGGVYAVETKTRRKEGGNNNVVVFDGQQLAYPNGTDEYGLKQARDNARWLSAWLSSATGEKTAVTPILTIPGWWIERRGKSAEIHVLNPKEIAGVIGSANSRIAPDQFQRICHQLDQKCRDVAF